MREKANLVEQESTSKHYNINQIDIAQVILLFEISLWLDWNTYQNTILLNALRSIYVVQTSLFGAQPLYEENERNLMESIHTCSKSNIAAFYDRPFFGIPSRQNTANLQNLKTFENMRHRLELKRMHTSHFYS